MNDKAGKDSPHLDDNQQKQAESLASVGPLVIHEIIREQGQKEQDRASSGLLWSGLAAGLSIGFSMVAQAYLMAGLPNAPWAPLVDSFGYSLGFLIVILGQQQLYTETALTAVIPALTQRDAKSIKGMLRAFGVWCSRQTWSVPSSSAASPLSWASSRRKPTPPCW